MTTNDTPKGEPITLPPAKVFVDSDGDAHGALIHSGDYYSSAEVRAIITADRERLAVAAPVASHREQQISEAAQLVFEGYNMPRDRYPDDYSYSLFLSRKLREAHGVMQCVRGVATWREDNCATAAPAPVAVAAEPVEWTNAVALARGDSRPGVMIAIEAATILKVAATPPAAAPAVTGEVARLAEMEARKDAAYLERNQVVAALAKAFPSGIARTAIEGWSEDWHGCVYIDLPTGQASWHFHDSQAYLFADLPPYVGTWDGHDTPEKYRRLASLAQHPTVAASSAAPAQPSDEHIIATWNAWPRQGITSRARAVEFVRSVLASSAAEPSGEADVETLTANGEYWPNPWPADLATSCRVIVRMSKNEAPSGASEDWWAGFRECANTVGSALYATTLKTAPEAHALAEEAKTAWGRQDPKRLWTAIDALGALAAKHDTAPQALKAGEPLCACKDRPASQCDEEWGPNCDLGNNEKHVRVSPVDPAVIDAALKVGDAPQSDDLQKLRFISRVLGNFAHAPQSDRADAYAMVRELIESTWKRGRDEAGDAQATVSEDAREDDEQRQTIDWQQPQADHERQLDELHSRMTELEGYYRDAYRYQFLRSEAYKAVLPHGNVLNGQRTAWITKFHAGGTFDAAIDAAIDADHRPSAAGDAS